jgi:riboflavin biosynthesis pyrimidine reductase
MIDMTFKKPPDSEKVTQIFPERRQVSLEGLYLDQRLVEISARIGRTLVIADFLTDRNGVIAKADEHHNFQVPLELRNTSDWRLFQELMAQADVIISGAAYLKRLSASGSHAQDVFSQFEPGRGFEKLGEWRLSAGYKKRSPDLAIVSRSLDFKFQEGVLKSGRRIVVFTTYAMAGSVQAKDLTDSGVIVIGSGDAGVEGNRMIDSLGNGMGHRVIMMATGPSVLKLLLEAKRLDLFYVTEAQLEIPFDDPLTVQTILPEGKKVSQLKEFSVSHQYLQENVLTENGSHISQLFLRYDRKGALDGGRHLI